MQAEIGAFFPLIVFGIGLIFSVTANKNKIPLVDNALRWLIFFSVGFFGLWAGTFQIFAPEMVAASIGWENSPFLFEVGCANLGMGFAGIFALWFRREYWLSLIIVQSVFLWGAAFGHIKEIMLYQNFSINNAGPILYTDIFIPLVLWILLAKHYCRVCNEGKERN